MKPAALFFGLSALLSATCVLAKPTATVQKRCEACDEACPQNHFYYHPTKCCLQNGGPPTVVSPPSGKGCPKDWYWHGDKNCCTPNTKPSLNFPNPSCDSTTYPWWNPSHQCCEHPSTPNQPQPQVSPLANAHKSKKSVHIKKSLMKKSAKARSTNPCPETLEYCPIAGSNTEYECVDPIQDIYACGGCPTTGKGQDCTAIPGALGVACDSDLSTMVSVCKVTSCQDGHSLSADGKSCTTNLTSQ